MPAYTYQINMDKDDFELDMDPFDDTNELDISLNDSLATTLNDKTDEGDVEGDVEGDEVEGDETEVEGGEVEGTEGTQGEDEESSIGTPAEKASPPTNNVYATFIACTLLPLMVFLALLPLVVLGAYLCLSTYYGLDKAKGRQRRRHELTICALGMLGTAGFITLLVLGAVYQEGRMAPFGMPFWVVFCCVKYLEL